MNLLRMFLLAWAYVSMATAEMCTDDVCEFTLVVRQARTMTYTGSDGKVNGIEILKNGSLQDKYSLSQGDMDGPIVPVEETITADGVQRNVILVNDQFPGPTLEVMEGAQVVLTVVNKLYREATSLHFHGMYMRGVPYMDGVPYVTQCPILPMHSFTYRFKAEPAGTHWYHSHTGSQKEDGLYGAFIVHKNGIPTTPSLPMFLQDWWHDDFNTIDVDSAFMEHRGPGRFYIPWQNRGFSFDGTELTALNFKSALINGRGRYNNNSAPLTRFEISSGETLRFRLINAGAEYTFRVSIDAHSMTVVANDGHDVEPVQVQSILVFPGESYDFEVVGDPSNSGTYWIRAQTLWAGKGPDVEPEDRLQEVRAILAYDNDPTDEDPNSAMQTCTENSPCRVLNCPFPAFPAGSNTECIYVSDLNSTEDYSMPDESENEEYFFNFGYQIGSSVNGRKFATPKQPLIFKAPYDITPCEATCETDGCTCTYTAEIPLGKTIRFVLMNLGFGSGGHHVIHLHGYDFRVLAMGFPEYNETTGRWISENADINCGNDNKCGMPSSWNVARPNLNYNRPPTRDTVVIPSRGYTVIEFRSNNPGFWLFHCHQTTHMNEGMSMIIAEALDKLPALPYGFPTCGDFTGTEKPPGGGSGEATTDASKGQSSVTLVELEQIQLIIIIVVSAALSATIAVLAVVVYNGRVNKSKKEKLETPPAAPKSLEDTVIMED
ncbi:L-ascorbate oxidase-like [Branchiostoma floridae]|uniref:ferroxidase n=1 Tax=Branchiostoma floridae TaxID=7739 RepID=A0A9J7HNF8_BRAFL|nr:L-ascorbate oxidase-like [Branchiostoma floridae]